MNVDQWIHRRRIKNTPRSSISKHRGRACRPSSKSEGIAEQRWGNHCLSTTPALLTLTVRQNESAALFCNSKAQLTSIFLCRGQLKCQSESQFGLATRFRQVPVGIYRSLRTHSSPSTASASHTSTTRLNNMFSQFSSDGISQIISYSKLDNTLFKIAPQPGALLL